MLGDLTDGRCCDESRKSRKSKVRKKESALQGNFTSVTN